MNCGALPDSVVGQVEFSKSVKLFQLLNFLNEIVTEVEDLQPFTLLQVLDKLQQRHMKPKCAVSADLQVRDR